MRRSAGSKEIEAFRRDYRRRVNESSNERMAEELGTTASYLSRVARGAKRKNGQPMNPGPDFLKTYYMTYPPDQSADMNDNSAKGNEKNSEYKHGDQDPLEAFREAQILYMNRTNEMLDHYKSHDEFSKKSFTEVLHIASTMAETQKQSVVNQGALIDTHREMTKGMLMLAETNREQYLALRGEKGGWK